MKHFDDGKRDSLELEGKKLAFVSEDNRTTNAKIDSQDMEPPFQLKLKKGLKKVPSLTNMDHGQTNMS